MNIKQLIKRLPPVRAIQEARYRRRFETADRSNLFYGVYDTFAEASSAAPKGKPQGYDNPSAAQLYSERHSQVYPADYPLLYWMARWLKDRFRVFEIGGHTGVSFYAYERYLNYPENFHWTISDVPQVAEAGAELARARGEKRLSFCSQPPPSDFDLLLSAGALQYLDQPLSAAIAALASPPRRVLLNLLPITRLPTYFTVQNMGPAYCPYRIMNQQDLMDDLGRLGYELRDQWRNPEKACFIPYSDPRYSLDHYRGYCFERAAST